MRTDWRWRRGYGAAYSTQMALMGGIGTAVAIVAILGLAILLALSGAL